MFDRSDTGVCWVHCNHITYCGVLDGIPVWEGGYRLASI